MYKIIKLKKKFLDYLFYHYFFSNSLYVYIILLLRKLYILKKYNFHFDDFNSIQLNAVKKIKKKKKKFVFNKKFIKKCLYIYLI